MQYTILSFFPPEIDAKNEVEVVCKMLSGSLTDVEKDQQPEIKTRLIELKELVRL